MKTKTKQMVIASVLIGIMLLFGFTPIGYIPLGVIQITLMCIPLIIGTLLLGLRVGIILGFVFAFTSLAQLLMGNSGVMYLLFANPVNPYDPFLIILNIFIPRILLGPIVYYSYKGLSRKFSNKTAVTAVCSAIGSLANTFIFLTMMYLLMGDQINTILMQYGLPYDSCFAMISIITLTNGLPEAIAAVVICTPVVNALRKIYRQEI